MTGADYANLIAAYIVKNYAARGIEVYREVPLGRTVIGKYRRVDVFVLEAATGNAFAIECKYQDSLGTVDEKIPYAIDDMKALPMPGGIVYAGKGFSEGILHMLAAWPHAARCMPGPDLSPAPETEELDAMLATTFRWWDLVLRKRKPFTLDTVTPP